MSLQIVVAAPFKQKGVNGLVESEFVVALSLDRDWFTPDQAKRIVDLAVSEGLLTRRDGTLGVEFDVGTIDVPDGFVPDDGILAERSAFERMLDEIVSGGTDKQTAVANINQLQRELDVTIETAAALYAARSTVDVTEFAERARISLLDHDDP